MSEQNTAFVNRIAEYGWVIEGGWTSIDKPDYWVGSSAWSEDPLRALRFARRQDAQQAADLMLAGVNVRICEHEWMPPRRVLVCGVDCHPGDANCNNYCNRAPQKGPMAAAELDALRARVAELKERLDAMIPLFEEARDALPAITLESAKLRGILLDLADRMDDVGDPERWAARKSASAASADIDAARAAEAKK